MIYTIKSVRTNYKTLHRCEYLFRVLRNNDIGSAHVKYAVWQRNAIRFTLTFVALRISFFFHLRYRFPEIVYYRFANFAVVHLRGESFSDGRFALRAFRKHLHAHVYTRDVNPLTVFISPIRGKFNC